MLAYCDVDLSSSDPAPTLEQFQASVAAGEIGYLAGSADGGATVYDLTAD